MTGFTIVRQGESVPFVFDRDGEDINGWVCTINVKTFASDASLITRVIEPDESQERWEGFLTSSETSLLSLTNYRLIGVLTNATTGEEEQPLIRFNITESWAD